MEFLLESSQLSPASPALEERRAKGREAFAKLGWPTRRSEAWKYTSLRSLSETAFRSSLSEATGLGHDSLKRLSESLSSEHLNLVFVNGRLDRTLSDRQEWPPGLSFTEQIDELSNSAPFVDGTEALAAAYAGHDFQLKVAAETVLPRPIRLHFHLEAEPGKPLMCHPRLQVWIGPRSKLSFIESFSGFGETKTWMNLGLDVHVESSAKVEWVRALSGDASALHLARSRYVLDRDVTLTHVALSSGGSLSRHDLQAQIRAPGTKASFLAAGMTQGEEHLDQNTLIDHMVGGSQSVQIYKNLLADRSRSAFTGTVKIRKGAQGASSEQVNRNLLLSSLAEADSQPLLLIEADDVKATHGSTVGQLDREEVFYLQSRGLGPDQAVSLLSLGFVTEVLDHVEDDKLKFWSRDFLGRALSRLSSGEGTP